MKIIGGLIPWIGFRVTEIDVEHAAHYGIRSTRMGRDMQHVMVEAFELEWLGRGLTLAARGIK